MLRMLTQALMFYACVAALVVLWPQEEAKALGPSHCVTDPKPVKKFKRHQRDCTEAGERYERGAP